MQRQLQTAVPQGHGNTIIQIIGDGNSVAPGAPHLTLTRYIHRRQHREALDWLSPYTRSTTLVGREHELQDLQAWLCDQRDLLARVMTGRGGRGKTRLALELCEWASENGWAAGFATGKELQRFFAQQNLTAWGWQRPTLIVIDYAAHHTQVLGDWIEELAERPSTGSPVLRMLLLEREASLHVGWCARIFASGGFGASSKRALLDPPEPLELRPLAADMDRYAIFLDLLGVPRRNRRKFRRLPTTINRPTAGCARPSVRTTRSRKPMSWLPRPARVASL